MAAAGDRQQEKVQAGLGREPPSRGSNRIVSLDDEKASPTYNGVKHEQEPQGKGWRQCLGYVGPGFLVAIAYLDPGNLETDLQAGSNHKYELLWIVLVGLVFALIIQSLAANLGVTTGKHLAEHCKAEYPKYVSFSLWVLAEVAVIAADIPEVIGTAFALNLLFRLPVWVGVLLTGLSTLVLLGVQRFGVRKLELLIAVLVFLMAGCFFGELAIVKPNPSEVLRGLFVPSLRTDGAVPDAIALLGALIMPHNLFLHSALVLSRKVSPTRHGIKRARRYFLLESGFALLVALLVNIAIVSVTGSVCSSNTLSANDKDKCDDLTLDSASFLLKNVLGGSSSTIYAIALLASGQSSTITGTYSGQFIMQGFLNLKMKKWMRNLFTRCIAIVPSLLVAIIGGSAAAGQLIIITSMILSFELPFAMIPLLKFSSSKIKLGPHKNSSIVIIIAWILGLLIIGINVYYLITAFMGWLLHNELPKYGSILVGLVVFPLMALYLASVVYLTLRKDKVLTFVDECKADQDQHHIENGLGCEMHMNTKREEDDQAVVPYREDLADIPFPE